MAGAIRETERRRSIQTAYNEAHGIVPKTIIKGVRDVIDIGASEDTSKKKQTKSKKKMTAQEKDKLIASMTVEMKNAARKLDFERAAYLRDEIKRIREE